MTFNPGEIVYIERQIFAHVIEADDMKDYMKFKQELPNDIELRKKYLQQIEWSKFKTNNKIAASPSM